MAISDKGYKRRTLEEIVNAKIAKAQELFGAEINTEENTALGKFIMICAYDQYHVEELAEQIYYSIFPQTAIGKSLDRLGWIIGISRNGATPAFYKVKVTGTAGATIGEGFLVGIDPEYIGSSIGTDEDLTFENTTKAVIGENGECEITVRCTTAGIIGNISPAIINRIVNPVTYVEAVQGIDVIEAATDEESDNDFRARYRKANAGNGGCTIAAITAAIISVPTVKDAQVVANETIATVDGIPPKTIACYVNGGTDNRQKIGEAILKHKPAGVGTFGNESVIIPYGSNSSCEVSFTFAQSKDIYVKLDLVTNDTFEDSGKSTIKENIENFINSLKLGETLITTALYAHIYKVTGVVSAVATISTDGHAYSTDNINVAAHEHCVLNTLTINGVTV